MICAATMHHRKRVLSLYRSLLREAGQIPFNYPRTFWRLKIRDWFRANTSVIQPKLREKKLKDRLRDLRRLHEAREGSVDSVRWMLQNAYARRGKLRSEIISNIANDQRTPEREAIIPQSPIKSRPPKLPPALISIFGFTHARRTKTLSPDALYSPPMLPIRADPTSEEARLLGPFSLRRKANIHRRFFREEIGRTMPPLELPRGTDLIVPIGLEDTGVFQELEAFAKPSAKPVPRRARLREGMRLTNGDLFTASSRTASSRCNDSFPEMPRAASPRYLRRRFREILAQTPILTQAEARAPIVPHRSTKISQDQWVASLSPLALLGSAAMSRPASAVVSHEDLLWIRRSQGTCHAAREKKR